MSNLLDKSSVLLTPTAYDNGKILSVKPNTSVGDFNFTRNSSATRVNSQGLIEDMQILSGDLVSNGDFSQISSELVTNGDFATDSNWFLTQATISNGKATLSTPDGSYAAVREFNALVIGKTYLFTIDVDSISSGSITVGNSGLNINSSGIYSGYYVSSSTTAEIKRNTFGSATNAVINSISVKEVGQDWSVTDSDANNYIVFNGSAARLKFLNTSPVTQLTSSFVMTAGKKYKLTVDIASVASGVIKIQNSGINENFNTPGISTRIINPTGAATLKFLRATANVDITLNSVSLIEITEDTNLPRIDYTGGVGHWLFEPESTNLVINSEDISNASWSKSSGAIIVTPNTTDTVSPSGNNDASKVVFDTANRVIFQPTTLSGVYSGYMYIKGVAGETIRISIAGNEENRTLTGGWDKLGKENVTAINNTINFNTYGGATARTIYVWGVQLEALSYSTSYIPTSGAISTRLQDAAFGAGSSDLINSTEGVLYAEIAALANDGTNRVISLSKDAGNRVNILYRNGSNRMRFIVRINNVNVFDTSITLSGIVNYNKVALSFKENQFKAFVNGVKEVEQLSGSIYPINTLDKLNFDQVSGAQPFYGRTKCAAVFKEALTDTELTCLTTI
jgi:hypothetical protein